MNLCLRLYRLLADFYPHEFRMVYGEELDQLGEEALPTIRQRYGAYGLVRLFADLALRLPAEYLDEIKKDVAYSARVLWRSPGFTAVCMASMAIGIGLCGVVLSASNGMLASPPGVPDPDGLLTPLRPVSYPYFERYRDTNQVAGRATTFFGPVPFAVLCAGNDARRQRFFGHVVSPEYFATLGIKPAAGRFFDAAIDKPGTAPVVVVSDRFWRTYLNSDPGAVGRTVRLNGQQTMIAGVAPRDFLGLWPWNPADLFVPVTSGAAIVPELRDGRLHQPRTETFRLVLRLAPAVTKAQAEAAFDALTHALDRESPDAERDRDQRAREIRLIPAGTTMFVTPENRTFVYSFNILLWTVVVSAMCANLANLLVARSAERRREIAIRLSVGASRLRLIRQLLIESALLSAAGGVAGMVLSSWIAHLLSAIQLPSSVPTRLDVHPDAGVLVLTFAISMVAGMSVGLLPALTSLRTDVAAVMKQGAQAPLRGYRRFGLRNLFMGYQVAASLILLLTTGTVVIGYRKVLRLDPGFDTAALGVLQIDPVRDGYEGERLRTLLNGLPKELDRIHGVHAMAVAADVPFANAELNWPNTEITAPEEAAGRAVKEEAFRTRIGAGYFSALGMRLKRGREFTPRDVESEPRPGQSLPAILNQKAAHALFGSRDPIGQRIREGDATYTVIGVAPDTHTATLQVKIFANVYLPLSAGWFASSGVPHAAILVRSRDVRAALAATKDTLASLHPELTLFGVQPMRERLAEANALSEWNSLVYVALGLFAILLACTGLAGVTAYAVARRRKEIGIRMALGARASSVRWLVLREGAALIAAGAVLGLAGATAIARGASTVTSMLADIFDTRAGDARFVLGSVLLLAALALAACYLPARRAAIIDPVTALREQ